MLALYTLGCCDHECAGQNFIKGYEWLIRFLWPGSKPATWLRHSFAIPKANVGLDKKCPVSLERKKIDAIAKPKLEG
jgi:hypothetical protein